jgi:inorganic pyrophosphatase
MPKRVAAARWLRRSQFRESAHGHCGSVAAQRDVRHLPQRAIDELEKFFEATDALERKKLNFLGWRGPGKAIKAIRKASI